MSMKAQVLAILPNLSKADLEQVVTVATALLGNSAGPRVRQRIAREEQLCDALRHVFASKLNAAVPPYSVVARTRDKAAVAKAVSHVDNCLIAWLDSPTLRRGDRIIAYRLWASLTVDWLVECGVPPSVRSVCNNVDKFAGLLDVAYPGYVAAGHAHLIFGVER